MNDFLAALYGNEPVADTEKTAQAEILETLEKVAAENGFDLNDLTDDEIVEIVNDVLAGNVDDEEKVASDDGLTDDDQEKLAEADFLGRVMAHALYDELASLGDGGEKTASDDGYEDMVLARANEILEAAAGMLPDDEEKVASDEEMLDTAALEALEAAGYDVDQIVSLLS